jgi:YfiH family protein
MIYTVCEQLTLLEFPCFKGFENTISHFVSTRLGGSSCNEYSSLNLGLNQADLPKNVIENRSKLASSLGILINSYVFARQTHSRNVFRVREEDRGKGSLTRETAIADTDGMITNVPGICLVTLAADCVPILFFDPENSAIGVAHAGWKGTVIRTPEVVVSAMVNEFGTNPSKVLVAIGPSAGPCCYEVGSDVIAEVEKSFGKDSGTLAPSGTNGKMKFDMWEANRITLIEAGVNQQNIQPACICTLCQNELFFSARKGNLGRFGAGIMLKNSI